MGNKRPVLRIISSRNNFLGYFESNHLIHFTICSMKNSIFVLSIVSFFICTQAAAQDNLSFGPVVGVNFSKLTGNVSTMNSKTGHTLGIFINYSTESRFGLNGQLLYSRLGGQSANGVSKAILDYVQIPVMGTYYLNGRGNKFRPKLMAGPYVGFLVNAVNENGVSINPESANRPYKGFDAGAALGAGLNFSVAPKVWLNTDVRYNIGLTQVMNTIPDVFNRSWGINVGLSFALGRYDPRSGKLR